jgi:hypothetical protein
VKPSSLIYQRTFLLRQLIEQPLKRLWTDVERRQPSRREQPRWMQRWRGWVPQSLRWNGGEFRRPDWHGDAAHPTDCWMVRYVADRARGKAPAMSHLAGHRGMQRSLVSVALHEAAIRKAAIDRLSPAAFQLFAL